MISAATKLASLRVIFYHTRTYYRMYGTAATLRKIVSYAIRRETVPRDQAALWSTFDGAMPGEITISHAPEELAPAGPITRRSTIIQEIEVGFESIDRIELLFATYNRENTSQNFVALVSEHGDILHSEQFPSQSVVDNSFFPLGLKGPIDLKQSTRLTLVLGSTDGTKTNSITAWINEREVGSLFSFAGPCDDIACVLEAVATSQAAPLRGSLVYRIAGRRTASHAVYHQPSCPAEFEQRCAKHPARIALLHPGGNGHSYSLPAGLLKGLAQSAGAEVAGSAEDTLARVRAGDIDLLVLFGMPFDESIKSLLQAANIAYIPSVYYLDEAPIEAGSPNPGTVSDGPAAGTRHPDRAFSRVQALQSCTFALCGSQSAFDIAASRRRRAFLVGGPDTGDGRAASDRKETIWAEMLRAYRRLHRPRVSIVTILYRKEAEIRPVLESYFRQTYEGELEIVFVDDCSPDGSVEAVGQYVTSRRLAGGEQRLPEMRMVRNEGNLGNCISRNVGIRHATGDVIIIVDADCMLNRDFVKRHVEAHAFDDCEVVIGPMNIETRGRDPLPMLDEYERRPDLVARHSALQDPINKSSFLNCITRNFSIKAGVVSEELFDPLFTYSADPQSGFGWEDVEMGYRLYKQGARIKFVDEAFSIHVSPPGADTDPGKSLRSMKNFRCLFEKHPDLAYVARRWVTDTYGKIRRWADGTGAPANGDREYLDHLLGGLHPVAWTPPKGKRYRVLTYRWHVPHQYELYKLPFDFTLVTGLGSPMTDTWEFGHRPLPANARLRSVDEIDPSDYDFAILHFDENVLAPENTHGVIGPDWGLAFKWLREHANIPKVAICHGTPQFYGQYNKNYNLPNLMQPIEPERMRLVEYLGDIPVVVNSHQAQREWQFKNSRVIWHGFDPAEFPPATYEQGILSPLGPLVTSRPHYRGYFLYKKVFEDFPEEFAPENLRVPEPHVLYAGNAYAAGKYRNYIDEIRRYSVYFNPTLRSPMPRARGEPMMCGVVTVSAHNHDVDLFIENGVNGFYSNDAAELRDFLLFLMRHPEETRRIGAAGRLTAMDLFNYDRYLGDWLRLVADVVGGSGHRTLAKRVPALAND